MWYNNYTAKLNIKPRGKSCAVKGAAFFCPQHKKSKGSRRKKRSFCCKNRKNLLTFMCARYIINVRTIKGGDKMSPSQGRPPIENPKDQRLYIRITSDEKAEIQAFMKEYGYSLLELIRLGIQAAKKEK